MFLKTVKYIFIGAPHCTKTTLSKKMFGRVFETDSLKNDEYNINNFNTDVECIIIGGKYYKKIHQKLYIIYKLWRNLNKKHSLIFVWIYTNKSNKFKKEN